MILILFKKDCLLFAKEKPDSYYELIIADPPYNDCIKAEWDNQWKDDNEYLNWLEVRIKEFSRILKPNGNLLMYCKRQFSHHIKIILDQYLYERRMIIWVRRRNMDITRGKTLASGYEPILWYSKSDQFIFNSKEAKIKPPKRLLQRPEYQKGGRLEKGISLTDAWTDIPALPHNSKEKTEHPTQKPLKISKRIVKIFSTPSGTVYIPFAGSGSEVLACIFLNRKWDATEINPTYINLIKKRLKNCPTSIERWLPIKEKIS